MQITGKLKAKMNIEVIGQNFQKRDFVITVDTEKYPQHIKFQLSNLNCNMISQYAIGSEPEVHFNVLGKEWINPKGEAVYFNTLEVWKIEVIKNLQVASSPSPVPNFENKDYLEDDLPF